MASCFLHLVFANAERFHMNINLQRLSFLHAHYTCIFILCLHIRLLHTDALASAHARLCYPACTERVMSLWRGERWSKWNENRENMTMLTWKGGLSNSGETWKTPSPLSSSFSPSPLLPFVLSLPPLLPLFLVLPLCLVIVHSDSNCEC